MTPAVDGPPFPEGLDPSLLIPAEPIVARERMIAVAAESVGKSAALAGAAMQLHVQHLIAGEHARLERDLGRALALQGDHRWRRIHVVSRGGLDATLADQVGWAASWRTATDLLNAEGTW